MRKSNLRRAVYERLLLSPKFSIKRISPQPGHARVFSRPPKGLSYQDIKRRQQRIKEQSKPQNAEAAQIPSGFYAADLPSKVSAQPSRLVLPTLHRPAGYCKSRSFLKSATRSASEDTDWQKYTEFTPYASPRAEKFANSVKLQDSGRAQDLLVGNKALLRIVNSVGESPLHWAVKRKDYATVGVLLNAGADVNHKDMVQRTPLYVAVRMGLDEITGLIFGAGGSAHTQSLDGSTPFSIASQRTRGLFLE